MIMLDTNVCSYIIRGEGDWSRKFAAGNTAEFAISSVVAYELELWKQVGDSHGALAQLITAFLRRITILPFGGAEAAVAAQVVSALARQGRNIGALDPLIAAHALAEKTVLVTANTKDFKHIAGLKVTQSF